MATSNTIPVVIPQPIAAQATSENINVIPNGATGTNGASFQEGFPAITRMPVIENPLPTQVSGLPPKQQDFNGLFNVVSQHNFFAQNGGTYSFNQAVSDAIGGYPKNSVLWYFPENEDPFLVYSLINNNTNNFVEDPTLIDDEHWKKLSFGGGGEIGDVMFAPLGIDESLNLRRYLNGQVLIQSQFVSFTNKVKSAIALYPNLATTEENWQAEKTNSKLGQCGKFVVDDTAGTIRLPCVVNAQGLVDLALIGGIKSESLPNINGYFNGPQFSSSGGAFFTSGTGANLSAGGSANKSRIDFSASGSSSTYQDNAPVQQEAVQYPYCIVVNTGTEESDRPINNYQVNNVYSYGMSQYYKGTMNNNSWLKSAGQWNSGTVYTGMYNWLLEQMNKGVDGFKGTTAYQFKGNTPETEAYTPSFATRNPIVGSAIYGGSPIQALGYATQVNEDGSVIVQDVVNNITVTLVFKQELPNINWFTDYDFAINTADQTFRLPLKNGQEGVFANGVKGNGMTLGLTNGTQTLGIATVTGNNVGSYPSVYGTPVGTAIAGESLSNKSLGVTNDPSKSGLVVDKTVPSGWNLYYYIGDTLQNAQLVNVARIEETLVTKTNKVQAAEASMPSDRYIDLTLGASGSTYTAPANGWFTFDKGASGANQYAALYNKGKNNIIKSIAQTVMPVTSSNLGLTIPALKGDVVQLDYTLAGNTLFWRFVYAEGENNV